jgi:hypothetical protein
MKYFSEFILFITAYSTYSKVTVIFLSFFKEFYSLSYVFYLINTVIFSYY